MFANLGRVQKDPKKSMWGPPCQCVGTLVCMAVAPRNVFRVLLRAPRHFYKAWDCPLLRSLPLPPLLAHSLMHASTSEADTALEGLAAAHDMNIVHKILMKAASAIHEQALRHFSVPETST